MREELFTKIEAYLANTLPPTEKAAFEEELRKDPDLRSEVELHRKVERELGDTAKRKLRLALEETEAAYRSGALESSGGRVVTMRRIGPALAIAASVLLLVVAVFWVFKPKEDITPIVRDDKADPVDTVQQIPVPQDRIKEEPQITQEEDKPQQGEEQRQELPENSSKEQLAALDPADFQPNPMLEPLVGANMRSNNYNFRLEEAKTTVKETGKVRFQVEGTLNTETLPEKGQFVLRIFSNKESDFEENAPLHVLPLAFEVVADSEKEFSFEVDKVLQLSSGLYYYILVLQKEEEFFKVGKFEVKN